MAAQSSRTAVGKDLGAPINKLTWTVQQGLSKLEADLARFDVELFSNPPEASKAHARMETSAHVGKIVLTVV